MNQNRKVRSNTSKAQVPRRHPRSRQNKHSSENQQNPSSTRLRSNGQPRTRLPNARSTKRSRRHHPHTLPPRPFRRHSNLPHPRKETSIRNKTNIRTNPNANPRLYPPIRILSPLRIPRTTHNDAQRQKLKIQRPH